MGKNNKKNKFNAYWCFRMAMVRDDRFRFINESKQQEEISQAWQSLSDEQKLVWKERANSTKIESKPAPFINHLAPHTTVVSNKKKGDKLNCLGESIEGVKEREQLIQEKKDLLEKYIKDKLNNANLQGRLDDLNFIFVSTTSFYRIPSEIYPAELAFSKFSLCKGVQDTLHFRINPGKLPCLSGAEAKEKSEAEHRYPLPNDNEKDVTDYDEILLQILTFVDEGDENLMPIFYAKKDKELDEVQQTLEYLLQKTAQNSVIETLKVYPVEFLMYMLNAISNENKLKKNLKQGDKLSSKPYAVSKFQNSSIISPNGCDFHMNLDLNQYCCLSRVRDYGYIIAKYCCDYSMYDEIEGQHVRQSNCKVTMNDY